MLARASKFLACKEVDSHPQSDFDLKNCTLSHCWIHFPTDLNLATLCWGPSWSFSPSNSSNPLEVVQEARGTVDHGPRQRGFGSHLPSLQDARRGTKHGKMKMDHAQLRIVATAIYCV